MSTAESNNNNERRLSASQGNDQERDWELDPDKPWQTKDYEERLERAKLQAEERNRIKPNYGKAGWSRR